MHAAVLASMFTVIIHVKQPILFILKLIWEGEVCHQSIAVVFLHGEIQSQQDI